MRFRPDVGVNTLLVDCLLLGFAILQCWREVVLQIGPSLRLVFLQIVSVRRGVGVEEPPFCYFRFSWKMQSSFVL